MNYGSEPVSYTHLDVYKRQQKYNRIVTTLDGLKKAVSEGDDLVS